MQSWRGTLGLAGRLALAFPKVSPRDSHPVRLTRGVLLATLAALVFSTPVLAQSFSGLDQVDATGTSYHRFVRPGEATMEILVLGNTASGLYVIGLETDMVELLALSGASTGVTNWREHRTVLIQLFRGPSNNRQLIAEARMQDVIAQPTLIPPLQDGDVVHIETQTRQRLTFMQIVRNISSVATLVFLAERLANAVR